MNAPKMTTKQALPMPSSTKPCPFCNGVANLFRADLYDDGSKVVYWHECCSCDATAGEFASEIEAETAWNRRAASLSSSSGASAPAPQPTSAPVTPEEIAEFRAHFLTADVRLQTLLDRVIAAALRAPSADAARPSSGGGE